MTNKILNLLLIIMALHFWACDRNSSGYDYSALKFVENYVSNFTADYASGATSPVALAYSLAEPNHLSLLSKSLQMSSADKGVKLADDESSMLLLKAYGAYVGQNLSYKDQLELGGVFLIHADRIIQAASQFTTDANEQLNFFNAALLKINEHCHNYRPGKLVMAIKAKQVPAGSKLRDIHNILNDSYMIVLSNDPSASLGGNGYDLVDAQRLEMTAAGMKSILITPLKEGLAKSPGIDPNFVAEYAAKILRGVAGEVKLADHNSPAVQTPAFRPVGALRRSRNLLE